MIKEEKIIIVTASALIGYSIKQLLSEFFDLNKCDFFASLEDVKKYSYWDNSFAYIIEPEILLSNYEFFMLRRQRTIIITEKRTQNIQFNSLFINDSIEQIVDSFQDILSKISSLDKNQNSKDPLSIREIDVLKLIIKGKINKEIAEELFISLNTVLTHRKNITSKLGIKTVSGLTFYAMMNGYINDNDI